MAAMLGWHIVIADGRPEYALPARFPLADKIIVAKPNAILPQLPAGKNIFALMTHNYNYDLALLAELLQHDFCYIGILGPRKKWLRMLEDLYAKNIHPSQRQLAAIHAPIGLDIGAETAEEIALSIIAEIKAVLAERSAAPLKQKLEAIHSKAPVHI
jgi:xanthine/CO dehydrogenase XdhC/CoxF family maturation factor